MGNFKENEELNEREKTRGGKGSHEELKCWLRKMVRVISLYFLIA
jgi:hypothetical protein